MEIKISCSFVDKHLQRLLLCAKICTRPVRKRHVLPGVYKVVRKKACKEITACVKWRWTLV
jgi:hypothetical protein